MEQVVVECAVLRNQLFDPREHETDRRVRTVDQSGRRLHGGSSGSGPHSRHRLTDRKSTRLNPSHVAISYAVFCLKKKNKTETYAQLKQKNECPSGNMSYLIRS